MTVWLLIGQGLTQETSDWLLQALMSGLHVVTSGCVPTNFLHKPRHGIRPERVKIRDDSDAWTYISTEHISPPPF